jgi:hypothetical protein
MMKIISYWYDYTSHSRIIGIVSLSFLFGDAFSRFYLVFLILTKRDCFYYWTLNGI